MWSFPCLYPYLLPACATQQFQSHCEACVVWRLQVVLVAHTARNEEGKADEKRQSNDVVSADEGRALAEELGVPFCSVREGCTEDVQGAFLQLYCAMGSELEHSRAAEAYSYCTVM